MQPFQKIDLLLQVYFLSIAKAMVYHHALARISSRAALPPLYLITSLGVYQKFFRNDDLQWLTPLMIDDIQCFALILH